jgi:hypothetical protein
VKSLGGKYCQANFLRAFQLKSDLDANQEDPNLLKCLLELEVCVALRTLPQKEFIRWLPSDSLKIQYPSVYLNIGNLLIQSIFSSDSARRASHDLLLESVDPEVRQWLNVRAK